MYINCKFCSKYFETHEDALNHIREAHELFPCKHCWSNIKDYYLKAFKRVSALKKHILKKHLTKKTRIELKDYPEHVKNTKMTLENYVERGYVFTGGRNAIFKMKRPELETHKLTDFYFIIDGSIEGFDPILRSSDINFTN